MKKQLLAGVLTAMAVLGVAGCNKEESKEKPKENATKVASEKKETTKEEKEVKESVSYVKSPLELIKQEQVIYESEKGKVSYIGYTEAELGEQKVALRYEGDMVDADEHDMAITFIASNNKTGVVSEQNKIETRVEGKSEVRLYTLSQKFVDMDFVRLDVVYERKSDGSPLEGTGPKTFKLKPAEGHVKLEGSEEISPLLHTVNVKKEGKDGIVTIESIEVAKDSKKLTVRGTFEPKKDLETPPVFSYLHPVTAVRGTGPLLVGTTVSQKLYSGTKSPIVEEIPLKDTIGKKEAVVYFSVDNVVFAFDLNKGKELNELDMAKFPIVDNNQNEEDMGFFGFKDVDGISHYNALHLSPSNFAFISEGAYGKYQFPVGGGYKTLSFDVGAAENKSTNNGEYVIQVYGDDYKLENNKIVGTPIAEKKVTKNSKLENMKVDVGDNQVITVVCKANKDELTPILFSDVTLKK